MNKKLFTILLVAVFLIATVSFISAADTSKDTTSHDVSVQIRWDDNGQTNERPGSVTVSLLKNGAVVDTKTLSSSNSWSATFKVQDDGSYSVKQETSLSDYAVSTVGDAHSGFMIINTLKSDVLSASEDGNNEIINSSTENEEIVITEDNATYNETTTEDNSTSENTTDNTTNDNSTSENTTDNTTDDNSTSENDNNTTVINEQDTNPVVNKHPDNTKNIKKATKLDKKPKKVTKTQLRNTGIPIAVLVVAAFAAAFVPFSRKK